MPSDLKRVLITAALAAAAFNATAFHQDADTIRVAGIAPDPAPTATTASISEAPRRIRIERCNAGVEPSRPKLVPVLSI